MINHWTYLKYVLKHKGFVFWAAMGLRVPWYRALLHDWTKFLPTEWTPYVHHFYTKEGVARIKPENDAAFLKAWWHHYNHNPHHWQYWLSISDSGELTALPMPRTYVREMVADWIGAGLARTGRLDVTEWWEKKKDSMILHPKTRQRIINLLSYL